MRRYTEYIRECYLIVRCLATRKHQITYSFAKNLSDSQMFRLAHCGKCDRYWV